MVFFFFYFEPYIILKLCVSKENKINQYNRVIKLIPIYSFLCIINFSYLYFEKIYYS